MIRRYIKHHPISASEKEEELKRVRKLKIIARLMFLLGVFVIASVVWPIAAYQIFTAPNLKPQEFLVPVIVKDQNQDISPNLQGSFTNQDLTHPANWFPNAQYQTNHQSKITHYTLSLPKFKIKDAVVEIGGDDLSQSLIQYPETALPGELGATIIFGHSILPQFFNPKNYMSIFSLIPTLELGDDIYIKFDGISYTYRVIDKVEVEPTNLSVLDQPYDNVYLRLITCTPPGTYYRRGVITAALVD